MLTAVDPSRLLFRALYGAALLVLLDQAAEALASLFPFNVGEARWRYAAFGFLASRTTTAVIFDALVLIAAVGLGNRRFLKAWAVVHLVVAALLLVALAAFMLDSLELRRAVLGGIEGSMALISARAGVVALAGSGYCVVTALMIFRATKSTGATGRPESRLVVQG